MNRPSNLKEYKFNDFPSGCYLKTRLNNSVLIIGYELDTQTAIIWLAEETFYREFPLEYIEASMKEIENAYELFTRHRSTKALNSRGSWCNPEPEGAAEAVETLTETPTFRGVPIGESIRGIDWGVIPWPVTAHCNFSADGSFGQE